MKKIIGTVIIVFLALLVTVFVLQKNNTFDNWLKQDGLEMLIIYKDKQDGVEIFILRDQYTNDIKLAFAKQDFLSSEKLIVGDFPQIEASDDINYKYSLITFKDNTNIPILYGFSNNHEKDQVKINYKSNGSMLHLETSVINDEMQLFWYYMLENPLSGTEESTIEVRF